MQDEGALGPEKFGVDGFGCAVAEEDGGLGLVLGLRVSCFEDHHEGKWAVQNFGLVGLAQTGSVCAMIEGQIEVSSLVTFFHLFNDLLFKIIIV